MPDLNLEGELDLLPTQAGGRRRPIRTGYRAAIWLGETAPTGRPQLHSALVTLPTAAELAPGEHADIVFAPLAWETWPRLSAGMRFELFEGAKHVGGGTLHSTLQKGATEREIRRALHATLEEWVLERFGERVSRRPRTTGMQPDLIASFRDQHGEERLLVAEVVGRRPTTRDVQRLNKMMRDVKATFGVLVGLDEPSAKTWSSIVAEGRVALPDRLWVPRIRVITTRELAQGNIELLPSNAPDTLELLAA